MTQKSIPAAAARCAALLLAAATAACLAQVADEAGRYRVDVEHLGAAEFVVTIGVEAAEPLEVFVSDAPDFVDAGLLPGRREVMPLFGARIRVHLRFVGHGSGRLRLAVRSIGNLERASYLGLDLHSGADGGAGGAVRRSIGDAGRLWREYGTAFSVVGCGDSTVACGGSLEADLLESAPLAGGRTLNGVLLLGCSREPSGQAEGIDAVGWGLSFDRDYLGSVGSLVLAPRRVQAEARRDEQVAQTAEEDLAEEVPTEDVPVGDESRPEAETEIEAGSEAEAEHGPYSGASLSVRIESLAAFGGYAQEAASGGHFGEAALAMPEDFGRLSEVESVELVLGGVESLGAAPARGRVYINTLPSIAAAGASADGAYSYGGRLEVSAEFLGDFDAGAGGREFRFDVTDWVRRNPSDRYYVIVMNRAGAPLAIESLRLEFSGRR